MSEVKTAVEAWEAAINTLELSTKAMSAAIKMMNGSRSNAMLQKSWEAVEATRDALVVAQEDEASKFKSVIAFNDQQVIDFDKPPAANPEPEPKGPKPLPQEPLALPAAGETSHPDGEEDVDAIVDDDDEDEDEDDPNNLTPAPVAEPADEEDEHDPDAEDEPEGEERP